MAKLRKKPDPQKKLSPFKKIKFTKTHAMIGSAVLVLLIILSITLNFTRVQYLFGKKDPIATVNNEPIYMKQLKTEFVKSIVDYQNLMGKSLIDDLVADRASRDSYQKDLLDSVIDTKVETIKANQLGIKLSDKELTQIDTEFKTNFDKLKSDLGDTYYTVIAKTGLEENDLSDIVKQDTTNDHITSSLMKKELDTYKKTIPQKDLMSVYARGLIMQLTTGKEAEIKKAAKDAFAMLKSGVKFEDVVKKYSKYIYNASGAPHPEIMGWINHSEVPAAFANKIFAVEPGHFTNVIENASACSIILIDKKKVLDINNLTTAEQQTIINSDNFKKYYANLLAKWKKEFKIYRYITNFPIS